MPFVLTPNEDICIEVNVETSQKKKKVTLPFIKFVTAREKGDDAKYDEVDKWGF